MTTFSRFYCMSPKVVVINEGSTPQSEKNRNTKQNTIKLYNSVKVYISKNLGVASAPFITVRIHATDANLVKRLF